REARRRRRDYGRPGWGRRRWRRRWRRWRRWRWRGWGRWGRRRRGTGRRPRGHWSARWRWWWWRRRWRRGRWGGWGGWGRRWRQRCRPGFVCPKQCGRGEFLPPQREPANAGRSGELRPRWLRPLQLLPRRLVGPVSKCLAGGRLDHRGGRLGNGR